MKAPVASLSKNFSLFFSLFTLPELISLLFGNFADVCNFSLAFKMTASYSP